MNILLIAPQPFYQERGTPIAIDHILRTFAGAGYRVDMATYYEGESRSYTGLRIFRTIKLPFVGAISPGFSAAKIVYDFLLVFTVMKLLIRNRYDCIHAVEEAAFLALPLSRLFRIPFIYDMDSVLSEQLAGSSGIAMRLQGVFQRLESVPLRSARAVVPVCDALAHYAEKQGAQKIVVLKDISLLHESTSTETDNLRALYDIRNPLVLYVGNLEAYQGIDLLLDAFAILSRKVEADLVMIGGKPADIEKYERRCDALACRPHVHFAGPRPVEDLAAYLRQADVLVSPRVQGTNTPMKIYSYLHSGVPVVATDLPTHTQVIDSQIAFLGKPTPQGLADALEMAIENEELAREKARQAIVFIESEHSYTTFKDRLLNMYNEFFVENVEVR